MDLNQTINGSLVNQGAASAINSVVNYFALLPEYVMQGNVVAIIIALLLLFVFIIIVNALSRVLLSFMKRTLLFFIIILIILDFFPKYMELVSVHGWTFNTIIIGLSAIIAGGFGFYIASRSLVLSAKNNFFKLRERVEIKREESKLNLLRKERQIEEVMMHKQQDDIKNIISKESLHNEKSVLAVLVYLIVAEFGVFSSPTLSAPTVQVGLIFFTIFIIGVLIFTKSAYKNFKTAATYFSVTFIIGLALAFALGILWGKNTVSELFSLAFFTSDSLVAMITGMGVSLFAGSKG